MIDISMEMEQYDCPFIDTTADYAVSFSSFQWEFNESTRELETRMVVQADERGALDDGLRALKEHGNMHEYRLLKRWDDIAHIRTTIDETDAMQTIRANDGYITGPFYVEAGSELWHVGFDSEECADRTLSDLERNNEYSVLTREQNSMPDLQELVLNANPAMHLIEGGRELSDVERETLQAAIEDGYFESPRETTLGALAEEFDISKPAVSKNLRRGQQKVITRMVDVLDDIDLA
ncbi:helix-turn-helix domain-containing protein [Salinibaculum rarum]|jgi:predicted DNA binding protein|uniref:helix-turn-helix domain-containing protein n=1 Tax=Salinibaculum rarum TaxID=3058903 RepID=UPI00265E95FE|nr:helix-turn-helix domain-containing protein [Salinibaculum sp. KK48]